ncbi:hybrid sensor histidine kinase/response regulator [Pseudohongiella sp.]|uniref:histidine kinase n=1 Tax=marine sediment metagenome TaxID=412755 RepID=A0A0F9W440_9ZZZZ|nr:PAS domain-containing sensor histidine kinase [Pseudohongiella sp.]HDZ10209.1 PAS domain-containing sensor histidine kinase [Pseudohongiella sp.]HEA64259.1 PAS domain-containing sensor histidine kinase [Pseudohongiella sp.]
MQHRRLIKIGSALSVLMILVLDSATPLGFAHGDLYVLSIILGALAGSRRFLIGVTITSTLLTVLGTLISPPGIEFQYWASNRAISIAEFIIIAALCDFIMQRFQRLQRNTEQLQASHQALQEMTPCQDNPLAPFQYPKQFQLFVDAIPQIIWTADTRGSIEYINLALSRYTGKPRAMLIDDNIWSSLVHPDDLVQLRERWLEAVHNQTTSELECRLRRHDGSWRWHLLHGEPVRDEQGNTIKWCGSATDIHNNRINTERFEMVAKATVDAISDWDIQSNQIWWNQGVTNLFGYTRQEMMAKPDSWTERLHPDDKEQALASIYGALNSDRDRFHCHYRFIRKDGSIAIVEEHGFVIRDNDGIAIRLIGGMTDITGKRQLEEQLSHAQRLQTVGELTGGVAHDFNNLLTVIQGNAELLTEDHALDAQQKPLVAMISDASHQAAELVQRLLAFARKQPLAPQPTDIVRLINNIQPLVRQAVPERINLELIAEQDLPTVLIDPPQLESAVLNLCLNARDAMSDQGKLLLEVGRSELDADYALQHSGVEPGTYVRVSVSDTGTGMSQDVQTRAFDPFFTTKVNGKGSGLGLSMVYGFVKQSGGHIAIYSEPGNGTTVRMYLPASLQQVNADTPEHLQTHNSDRQTSPAAVPEPGTVLLVEDEPLVRQYAETQFQALGFHVISASHGDEALNILRQLEHIDLLFTDVMMGDGMDGPELASEARKLQPDITILFTSGYTENAMFRQGRLEPGTDLLVKPWRREDLLSKLKAMAVANSPNSKRSDRWQP